MRLRKVDSSAKKYRERSDSPSETPTSNAPQVSKTVSYSVPPSASLDPSQLASK